MPKLEAQSSNSELPVSEYRPYVTTAASLQECITRVARNWRILNAGDSYHRLTVARMHCQNELFQLAKKISGEIPFLTDDRVSVLMEADCPAFKTAVPIIFDARCDWSWGSPFVVFYTDAIGKTFVGAKYQYLFTASWPQSWYPIPHLDGISSFPIEWFGEKGDSHPIEENIDIAFKFANDSITRWQSFWEIDARWQREMPSEWFRSHVERLQAHVEVIKKLAEIDRTLDTFDRIGEIFRMAHSLVAARFLSAALLADAVDIGIKQNSEVLLFVKSVLEAAGSVYPDVRESEFSSPEFWAAAEKLAVRLASTTTATQSKVRRQRGRKKADDETVRRESMLAEEWSRARDSDVYKPDFAKEHGMTAAKLDALLDRVAKRNSRSDK